MLAHLKCLILILIAATALGVQSAKAQTPFEETKALAEQGDASAQSDLGMNYYYGRGVPEDDAQAVKWYRKAAQQGEANAQTYLGFMYAEGEGVQRDNVTAYQWVSLAAAQSVQNAIEAKPILVTRMTPEQIAKAQALSTACYANDYKGCR